MGGCAQRQGQERRQELSLPYGAGSEAMAAEGGSGQERTRQRGEGGRQRGEGGKPRTGGMLGLAPVRCLSRCEEAAWPEAGGSGALG